MFAASAVALLAGVSAPYGRYVEGSTALFGCVVPNLAAWVIQEIPNLIALAVCWSIGDPALKARLANLRQALLLVLSKRPM